MDVDNRRFAEELYEPSRARVETWLRSNPSPTHLDPDDYRRLSLLLADAEGVPAGAARLAPNNSVEMGRYDQAPPMSIAELAKLRDDFQVDALDLALQLAALRLESRPRLMVKLATLIAAAGLCGRGDYDFWPISMLAHSEAFLHLHTKQRAAFERLADQLVPLLEQSWRDRGIVTGAGTAFLSSSPDLQAWSAALDSLNHGLLRLVDTVPQLRNPAAMPEAQMGALRPYLDWDGASLKALMMTPPHLRYRIMINFVYGLFPLIGLKPVERAFLCYLIWNTVERAMPELVARADRAVRAAGRPKAA
jgi:hypothetical protein